MSGPTEEQILSALQNSGYLFEHEIATKLEQLEFHVETSWAFLDADSEKSRELDIRAIRQLACDETNKIQLFVELLVECKASESPFVFLERTKNTRESLHPEPKEYLFPRPRYTKRLSANSFQEVPAFTRLGLRDSHYYYSKSQKATQFAKIVRDKATWQANHDGVYDSILLPMAKALQRRQSETLAYVRGTEWKAVWLFFPVVVLRDHLYAYDLSIAEPKIEPKGRVSFIRNLDSGNLKGFYMTDFVTSVHLSDFIQNEVLAFGEAVAKILHASPRTLVDDDA